MAKKENKTELTAVEPGFSLIDENLLKSRIHTIRGVKVMLDADLAEIYGYSTKAFNRQVKNNIERFAEDFRFQLSKREVEDLRSKILTAITDENETENLRCKNCTAKKMLYQSVYSRQNRGKIIYIRPIANCPNRKVQHLPAE